MADIAKVKIVTSKGVVSAGDPLPSDLPNAEIKRIKELDVIERGRASAPTVEKQTSTPAASAKKPGPSAAEKKARKDAENAVKDAEAAVKNAASDEDKKVAEDLLEEAKQALADLG